MVVKGLLASQVGSRTFVIFLAHPVISEDPGSNDYLPTVFQIGIIGMAVVAISII